MIRHQPLILLRRSIHFDRRCISTLRQRSAHSASTSCASNGSGSNIHGLVHHYDGYFHRHHRGDQARFFSNNSHGNIIGQLNVIDDDAENKADKKAPEEIDLSEFTKEVKIEMPELVEGSKAKVVKWYKEEGDIVHPEDTICDIETEMFTFGMDVDDECIGVMKEILLLEGEEHDSSKPICIILHKEEKVKENDNKED